LQEKIIEIYEGIKVHLINTNKFKTDLIGIFLITDLNRETVTKNALIPAILKRGTINHPTMKDINIELEKMYGSVLDCGIEMIGERHSLQFYIRSLSNRYITEDEDLLDKSIDLISDVILKPRLENNMFLNEYLVQEKETLRELIESKINDKSSYAIIRCIENMCVGEPFSLYKYGYVEDLSKITGDDLYKNYLNILQNSKIEIYVSGNFDEENVLQKFKNRFSLLSKRNYTNNDYKWKLPGKQIADIKKVVESLDVNQGKLVMGLNVNVKPFDGNLEKILIYNIILGGSPNSKLFQNIREKESLAYTTKSSYLKHKGILLISAGIDIENYEKTFNAINNQLEDMKKGNFSEDDIKNAITIIKNLYKSFNDEQSQLINLYMGQEMLGAKNGIEEIINNAKGVSKKDVIDIANNISLDTVYFMTNRGEK
jgi:predicted Zn-dependent peptidase